MRLDRPTLIVVLVCAALTLLFGIYPQPLIQMTSNAAGYLFASI